MKVNVLIDIDTLEGKQIIDYLKGFPEIVTFEDKVLNETQQEYITKSSNTIASPKGYIPIEEFRIEAKKRAKIFLEKHALHS